MLVLFIICSIILGLLYCNIWLDNYNFLNFTPFDVLTYNKQIWNKLTFPGKCTIGIIHFYGNFLSTIIFY